MREVFVLEDILNALITLETHGNALYSNMAEQADDLQTRNLFADLAEQELQHKKIYEGFKTKFNLKTEIEEDYLDYLRELIRSSIQLERVEVRSYNYGQALAMGIQLEKDTILFLNELKGILAERADQIGALVQEEKKHLVRLLELKRA